MPFDRKTYMREYMRDRRGYKPAKPRDWMVPMRSLYARYLSAQREISLYQNEAMRVGVDPTVPAHLTAALAEAEAALEAHAATDPERAAEYYKRHEAHELTRTLAKLRAELAAALSRYQPPRGRPARVSLPTRLAEARRRHIVAEAQRDAAADALRRLTLNGRYASPRALARAETKLNAAHRREAARHHDLHELLALQQRVRARAAGPSPETVAGLRALVTDTEREIRALLAGLPDPPRAPLFTSERAAALAAKPHRATGRPRGRPRKDPTAGLA